jgi:hypothetical protein
VAEKQKLIYLQTLIFRKSCFLLSIGQRTTLWRF